MDSVELWIWCWLLAHILKNKIDSARFQLLINGIIHRLNDGLWDHLAYILSKSISQKVGMLYTWFDELWAGYILQWFIYSRYCLYER